MKRIFLLLFIVLSAQFFSQTNIISTNPLAEQIMLGNYDPALYMPSTVLNTPDSIYKGINNRVSPDSLKAYIIKLASFKNRNTGSDTLSNSKGIGAARRWVHQKFQEFSLQNQNRLIPSYLQFDLGICGVTQHRDIFAVLPGIDTSNKSVIIVEGHIDSRCEGLCDSVCNAQGVEDNASGTALVMELARVMSKYSYNHTIVFLVTIGEEQGLYGAEAFADFVQQKGIQVKAVQNNDVIGGIICGATSSPPSCNGMNMIDSLNVRLFSAGGLNSKHKGLARFIKLEYNENLKPVVAVPMSIKIMTPEDRTGRSGDHVPFRQHLYTSMRFTSANEHGDANVSNASYADRQHSVRDTLGADTDGDLSVDSFFVDFNYLARNTVINGNSIGMLGIGPKTPTAQIAPYANGGITVTILTQTQYPAYRVAVRSTTFDWDTVFTMTGTLTDTFPVNPSTLHFVSVMSCDSNGVESLPQGEYTVTFTGKQDITKENSSIELLQNKPNPFDEATYISFFVKEPVSVRKAEILITDIGGKTVQRIPVKPETGMNEVLYTHGYGMSGVFYYSLVLDGKVISTRSMVFAN